MSTLCHAYLISDIFDGHGENGVMATLAALRWLAKTEREDKRISLISVKE